MQFRELATKFGKETFQNRDEVYQAITQYIATKPAQFFRNGINKLIERWRYIVDNDGIYYEE